MIITDIVYRQIRNAIALHQPERGGALYGPRGYPVVTHFEFDPEGKTSPVSYVPSSRLIDNVGNVERNTGLQLKGIVHSHPKGLPEPSRGDVRTAASFFQRNPHFAVLAMPIVQPALNGSSDTDPFLYWYRMERRPSPEFRRGVDCSFFSSDGVELGLVKEDVYVIPLRRDGDYLLASLSTHGLNLTFWERVQHIQIQHAQFVALVASDGKGHEFMYLVSFDYPLSAPNVFYLHGSNTKSIEVSWDGTQDYLKFIDQISNFLVQQWT